LTTIERRAIEKRATDRRLIKDKTMLKGLGGLGDMGKLMKQAQEMQSKMEQAQARLDAIEVTGQSGAGMVTARVSAKGELRGISIDPGLFNADDREVVEDLILAAVKDAQAKAAETSQSEMGKLTEGLNLPAGMKLPF
jgi:nucleoid-associated protein EbfC